MRRKALATLGALTLALIVAAPAHATLPGANGRIAFSNYVSGGDEDPFPSSASSIDVAFASGKARRSLRSCPNCPTSYRSPAWSPRGTHLAFDAGFALAVMRSDGSDYRLLPQQTADDGEPSWSPDGTRIVFSGRPALGALADLYVHDLASGDTRRLTFGGGRSPDWSSRGLIAFVRGAHLDQPGFGPNAGDVFVIRANGRGLRRITYRRGEDPSWAPDGRRIAFSRQRRFGGFRLWIVRADGRGLHRLPTPEAGDAENPSWSPDGRWIAYEGFESGVFAQRLDGSRYRQVASSQYSSSGSHGAFDAAWQPLPRR